jgi:protein-disulfide isomerase
MATSSNPSKTSNLAILALLISAAAFFLSILALLTASGVIGNSIVSTDTSRQAETYAAFNPDAATVAAHRSELFADPNSPVGGNSKGDVTVVEFFDYNCPYCRAAEPMLEKLVAQDHQVRIVYKEFPILGPGSHFAAQAALAADEQGKYLPFQKAMLSYQGSITEDSAMSIAKQVGLDTGRLQQDMLDAKIGAELAHMHTLADTLRLSGTPSFVVGDTVFRGLVDLQTLQHEVAATRQKASAP